jgi:hypothetical protein
MEVIFSTQTLKTAEMVDLGMNEICSGGQKKACNINHQSKEDIVSIMGMIMT